MTSLATVIVTHNNAQVIGQCLESLARDRAVSLIIVVDSSSSDGTVDAVLSMPHATLYRCKENVGFAAACNIGVRQAPECDWILFLNPDTVVQPDAVSRLVEAAVRNKAALAGGRLVNPDGTPQIGYIARRLPRPAWLIAQSLLLHRVWPRNPLQRAHLCMDLNFEQRQQIEHPSGALLLVSREAFRNLDGFDEGFYLSFEDTDLCRRAQDAGLRIIYEPLAVVVHYGGVSFKRQPASFNRPLWFTSVLNYGRKHFSPAAQITLRAAAVVGALVRAVLCLVNQRFAPDLRSRLAASAAYVVCAWRAATGTLVDSTPRPGRDFERLTRTTHSPHSR